MNKGKQENNQILLMFTCTSLLTLFLAMPGKVSAFTISELAGWIWQIINNTASKELNLDSWLQVIEDILNDPCKNLSVLSFMPTEAGWCTKGGDGSFEPIGDIVRDARGPMEIPNPNETRGRIEQSAGRAAPSVNADVFEINNVVWSVYAANQVDRDLTRIGIESVLGASGQEKMQSSIDETKKIVQQVGKDADAAQRLDVTQDVMKLHAKNFAQQTAILGALRADNLKARVDSQFTNLNLMNISRTLDEQTRSERVDLAGNAMLLLDAAGQVSLR